MSFIHSMDGHSKITIVIPTMRKAALPQVVAAYGGMVGAVVQQIVIVDFDYQYTSKQHSTWPIGVRFVRICGEPNFNKSLALNLGFQFVIGWTLFCDADVILDRTVVSEWTRRLDALGGRGVCSPISVVESHGGHVRPAPGIVATSRAVFEEVGGFRSDFEGWGLEDRDFLLRVELSGIPVLNCGSGLHLSHSDEERTQNYSDKDRVRTRERNLALLEDSRASGRHGTLLADTRAFHVSEESANVYNLYRI